MGRVVAHVDMDAFFAAVEQHDDPSLRGKPLLIGGTQRRGVVSTASYEARPFGVGSAMPMAEAMRLCPQAIVIPPRMSRYMEVSEEVMDVLATFSPTVEPLSLDEAFLDMTGAESLFGAPREMATRIVDAVRARTQLTCSVGVASNKFLAKLASDLDKPAGVTVVPAGREAAFIAPLGIRHLWGVGPKTARALLDHGYRTIGDIAQEDGGRLVERFGPSMGTHLHALANAEDDRMVVASRQRKSVGSEVTLEHDIRGVEMVAAILKKQCERVGKQLRRAELQARGVRVKLRYSGSFQLASRQSVLATPFDDGVTLAEEATALLAKLDVDSPIRLVGAAAFQLEKRGATQQLDLFEQQTRDARSKLEHTVDDIVGRFGDKIRFGS